MWLQDLVVLGGAESSLPTTAPTTPGESKTVGTDPFSPRFTQDHQGIYVDKGVGSSPRIFRVNTDVSLMDGDTYLDSDETEVGLLSLLGRQGFRAAHIWMTVKRHLIWGLDLEPRGVGFGLCG